MAKRSTIFQAPTFKLPTVKPREALPPTRSTDESHVRSEESPLDAAGVAGPARWFSPLILYVTALFLCYASLVVVPYAFLDDYTALDAAQHHDLTKQIQTRVAGGRVILAALTDFTFSHMHSVGRLGLLRFGGIVGLVALAFLIYYALVRAGMDKRIALLLPLIICTLPAFQIFAAWAIAAAATYAMVAGGLGALLAERAYDLWAAPRQRLRAVALAVSAPLVLLAGMAIGQPPVMVYWLFVGILLLVARRTLGEILRRLAVFGAVALLGMAFDYLLVRYAFVALYGHESGFSRTALAPLDEVPGKIVFFGGVMVDSLNFHSIGRDLAGVSSFIIAALTGVIILVGLPLYFRGTPAARAGKLAVALALLPVAYVPNLVIAESWGSYRTQSGVSGLCALYLALALIGLIRRVSHPLSQQAPQIALGAFAVIGLVSASFTVTTEIAVPSYVELHVAVTQLDRQRVALANADRIYFIRDTWPNAGAHVVRHDEFGFPSGWPEWNVTALTHVAVHQVDPSKIDLPVTIIADKSAAPSGSVVIDMGQISSYQTSALPGREGLSPIAALSMRHG